MTSSDQQSLTQRGIAAAQDGDEQQARALLTQAVRTNPQDERAWLWLASVVAAPEQQRQCLERVLALNPTNSAAQQRLAALAAQSFPEARSFREASAPPPTSPPTPVAAPPPRQPIWQDRQARQPVAARPPTTPFSPKIPISGAFSPEDWLAWLVPAAQAEITKKRASGSRKRIVIGLLVVGIIGGLLIQSPTLTGFSLIFLILTLLFFNRKGGTTTPLASSTRRLDAPANLYQLVIPLITALRHDLAQRAPLTLSIDLRGATLPEKRTFQNTYTTTGGRQRKVTEEHFSDTWFSGSAELAHGGVLRWQISDALRSRNYSYRSRSGKHKSKRKRRVKTRIRVELVVRDDQFRVAPGPCEVRRQAGKTTIRCERNTLSTTPSLNQQLKPAQLFELIQLVIRQARPRQA